MHDLRHLNRDTIFLALALEFFSYLRIFVLVLDLIAVILLGASIDTDVRSAPVDGQ